MTYRVTILLKQKNQYREKEHISLLASRCSTKKKYRQHFFYELMLTLNNNCHNRTHRMSLSVLLLAVVVSHLLDERVELRDLRAHELDPEARRRGHRRYVHLYRRTPVLCAMDGWNVRKCLSS